jgi:hypothetical protein
MNVYQRCPRHRHLREFSKKFKTAPLEYLGAWGTLIHEKNLKSKISCQTPFKCRAFQRRQLWSLLDKKEKSPYMSTRHGKK